MSKTTIGELAIRTGLKTSAIRYYEQIGLLPEAERENGQRRYGEEILEQLAIIKAGKRVGFSLNEIKEMLTLGARDNNFAAIWNRISPTKIAAIDAQIEELTKAKELLHAGMNCGCESLTTCAEMLVE